MNINGKKMNMLTNEIYISYEHEESDRKTEIDKNDETDETDAMIEKMQIERIL